MLDSGAEGGRKAKIYIAGCHVFRPDADEYGLKLRKLCERYGFDGMYPKDNEPVGHLGKREIAALIFRLNEEAIREADIVVADLNPFRGQEPDSGTSFECGFGYALGKRLYGYVSDGRSMRERLAGSIDEQTGLHADGMKVEDFDLSLNLMLSVSMKIVVGDFEACLRQVRSDILVRD